MKKCGKPGHVTDDNIIRRMCFTLYITKATNTHSEYVILIAFFHGNSGYANAPQFYVISYISRLVVYFLLGNSPAYSFYIAGPSRRTV